MSFPKFSKLPPELRRIIWQFACEDPRLLDLSGFNDIIPIPGVLHTTFEARKIAIQYYAPFCNSTLCSQRIFFNSSWDRFYLSLPAINALRWSAAIDIPFYQIERLVLPGYSLGIFDVVRFFPRLKELVIVTNAHLNLTPMLDPHLVLQDKKESTWMGVDMSKLFILNMKGFDGWEMPKIHYMEWISNNGDMERSTIGNHFTMCRCQDISFVRTKIL